ncbi:MAG: translation elongation factor 4 [Caldisericia bacterium]|nr:translation elongation factor 4 [Caldisericia bacterium]
MNIRNFSVIAHIDHGKSTLCDRFLELCGLTSPLLKEGQALDQMSLERERGITIKAHPVRLIYKKNNENYILNLIDTPGHVDFTYEVSRSLAACEGAILLVDATQGVEAQTLSHYYLAKENNLKIIPVINKIDLPNARIEEVKNEIINLTKDDKITLISAKSGIGVEDLLDRIINEIPPPNIEIDSPLKALIFDSHYDKYKGVIVHIRVFEGKIKKGMKIMLYSNKKVFEVIEVGVFELELKETDELKSGEVGYFAALIRDPRDIRVGDTVIDIKHQDVEPLPGFKVLKPVVFASIYPTFPQGFESLRKSIERLYLNDPGFVFEPEDSSQLGPGFRCGFLGSLHLEIVEERLEREFEENIVITYPSTKYRVILTNGEEIEITNPSKFPDESKIKDILEPIAFLKIITPSIYIGEVLKLIEVRKGRFLNMIYIDPNRVIIEAKIPFSKIITKFFDDLKSITKGFGTFDYTISDWEKGDLIKVDILVNGKIVDALSFITYRDEAYRKAKDILIKMRNFIPRQLFEVVLQAKVQGKIIARESIAPLRKDVLQKCYGGDVTRKKKLLEKQKEGKKRMKMVGNVEIPQEAFLSIMEVE